jgi:hypothetical protein
VALLKVCSEPGCGRPYQPVPGQRSARCPLHAPAHKQARASKVKASGTSSAHWQRLRKQALERDGYRCQRIVYGQACLQPANTVHIAPHLGRNHDLATLDDCMSMCRRCHGAIDGARAHH